MLAAIGAPSINALFDEIPAELIEWRRGGPESPVTTTAAPGYSAGPGAPTLSHSFGSGAPTLT